MFLALSVMILLLGMVMLTREIPTHLVASEGLKMDPQKRQEGHLQKQFRKTNVKKLKHQLKHVMEELH